MCMMYIVFLGQHDANTPLNISYVNTKNECKPQ